MVDFSDSPEEHAFRAQVREFVEQRCPRVLIEEAAYEGSLGASHVGPTSEEERERLTDQWRDALLEKGWMAAAWPKKYGGGELSLSEQFILNDELAALRAPQPQPHVVGSTLMVHGTEEQKRYYLPKILSGEMRFAQGYSEPNAGSDLASLTTRAVRDGDDFIINGSKIWTSGAHRADMIFALVRTDPDAPKHRGITFIMFSMKSPGISIRRIEQMSGTSEFNQVFFEDVRAPASGVVGEINRGWYVGATHLDFERSGIAQVVRVRKTVTDLVGFLKTERDAGGYRQRLDNDVIRNQLADCRIGAEVAVLFSYRVLSMQRRNQIPNYEASTVKVFRTELSQRTANAGVKALGLYGLLFDREEPYTPMRTKFSQWYLSTVSETIGAGTSEIQRGIIATRGFGLPRG